MSGYRKIYEQHHGPIPKDKDGRTYDIHHIDGNHKNDSPENLKAVSIQDHYDIHHSQEDWMACHQIAIRMSMSLNKISDLAKAAAQKRILNGTHHFLTNNPNLQRIANGTHNFLGGEIQKQKVKNGTHPFQTRTDGTNIQTDRIAAGTHHCLGENNPTHGRIIDGTHNFITNHPNKNQPQITCPYCLKTGSNNNMKRYHFDNCKKLVADR
jgi:hypothetical protein